MAKGTVSKETNVHGDGNVIAEEIKANNINIDNSIHHIQQVFQKPSLAKEEVGEKLWQGTYRFYKKIRGENGRFEGLTIYPALLASGKVQLPISFKESGGAIVKELAEQLEGNYSFRTNPLILNTYWAKKRPHILLQGAEGMGKTISLLHLWQQYLPDVLLPPSEKATPEEITAYKQQVIPTYTDQTIPIYIALNEYNSVSRTEQEKFLTHYIAKYYLGIPILDNTIITNFEAWAADKPSKTEQPKLLLLLDGLDEITSDITPLLMDLNKWAPLTLDSGIQVVVSSRFESNHEFATDFSTWALQPLNTEAINRFLTVSMVNIVSSQSSGDDEMPTSSLETENINSFNNQRSPALDELLGTPMMLGLYYKLVKEFQKLSGTQEVQHPYMQVQCTGELLRKYLELKLVELRTAPAIDSVEYIRNHFLVQYLIPFVAYQMEQDRQYELPEKDLEGIINLAFKKFHEPQFLMATGLPQAPIKHYRKYIHALHLGTLPLIEAISRFEKLMEDFQRDLYPITREGVNFRFFHQYFQTFFAAKHLQNEINLALEKQQLPSVLKDQRLAPNLQKMLGEILGEHRNHPSLMGEKEWETYYMKTDLGRVLDLCKGVDDPNDLGYTVWNILNIWKTTRTTLAGADLSNLNLSGFDFNGISGVANTIQGAIVNSQWDNSILAPQQWFPQGHAQAIRKIRVSPDGKYLATASKDHTIKLWLVATNGYVRTFHNDYGHFAPVTTMTFSPDSQRLVTGAEDSSLIEWNITTGQAIHVFRGHSGAIRSVAYHPKGEKFVAADAKGSVQEWCTNKGKSIFTYDIAQQNISVTQKTINNTPKSTLATHQNQVPSYDSKEQGEEEVRSAFGALAKDKVEEASKRANPFYTTSRATRRNGLQNKNSVLIDSIQAVLYTKNGHSLLVGYKGGIIELAEGTNQRIATYNQVNILAMATSPTENKVIAISKLVERSEWQIQEWSLTERRVTQLFTFDRAPEFDLDARFLDLTYSPTSKYILVAGLDDNIYEWATKDSETKDAIETRVTQTFKGHPRRTTSIVYHPNGNYFYSGAFDATSKKWSTLNGQILHNFCSKSSPYNNLIKVPNSDWLIASSENGAFHRWNIQTKKRDLIFQGDGPAYTMDIYTSENTQLLVTGEEWGMIQVWTVDGKCVRRFTQHQATVTSLSINPSTGAVVSGDEKGHLFYWSLVDEALLVDCTQSNDPITNVTFSPEPESTQFITCYENGPLHLWAIEKNDYPQIERTFDITKNTRIYTADFDGQYILIGKMDGTIEEWSLKTGEKTYNLQLEGGVIFVAYSDCIGKKQILVGVKEENNLYELPIIELGDTRDIDLGNIQKYEGHEDYILGATYEESMDSFFSIAQDCTLRQWDRKTRKESWGITNIPGLLVADLDFTTVRWSPPLTNEEYELLHQYQIVPCY